MNQRCRGREFRMNSTPQPAFRLRLFGTPTVEGPEGTPVSGKVAQRHRLAVLALLALAPAQRLSRDKLIAFLWPESDAERGRNLLNVATYNLRAVLGETALLSSGDELQLNAGQVDALDFEAAVERGDYAFAVTLYRAPFLDGFFVSDAPEFERWVSMERDRLALNRLPAEAAEQRRAGDRAHRGAVPLRRGQSVHRRHLLRYRAEPRPDP